MKRKEAEEIIKSCSICQGHSFNDPCFCSRGDCLVSHSFLDAWHQQGKRAAVLILALEKIYHQAEIDSPQCQISKQALDEYRNEQS